LMKKRGSNISKHYPFNALLYANCVNQEEQSIVDRIRGHLAPPSQSERTDRGQNLTQPPLTASSSSSQGRTDRDQNLIQPPPSSSVQGRKGTGMKEMELQLARDRINREKSLIRETSQVFIS
jgi:hypothetical protein